MNGDQITKARAALREQYTPLHDHVRELSVLYTPYENNGSTLHIFPWNDGMMHDSTPRQAAGVCTNGLCSLVAPRAEEWFEWEPPPALKDDDAAVAYYRRCSEVARQFLDSSNFYEEFHSAVRELVIYGTGNLFCGDLDERGELFYRTIPLGSYYFSENVRGRPMAVYRDLRYTARQAADEFGKDRLPKEIRDKLDHAAADTELHEFVHAVYRRDDAPDPEDAPNMQGTWMSRTVHEKSKEIVNEATFNEFPFAICRYERYPGTPWGFGPGSIAKGDARQLNFLNELADVATEKSVFPATEAPASMEGEIGLGAAEINYRPDDLGPGQITEIGSAARFDVAFQRIEDKRDQINRAFFVDLFAMFANLAQRPGEITAYQASQMAGEKLAQFSPIFGRLVSEMLDVVLDRLFGVLLRAGMFPEAPRNVLQMDEARKRARGVVTPAKLYKNRIVLALQAKQNNAILDFMGLAGPIAQLDPTALDVIDIPAAVRGIARNSGVAEDYIRPPRAVAAMQQQRAEQAAMQQEIAAAESISKSAQNFSNSDPAVKESLRSMAGI